MATLDLINVQKSFGPTKILHNISSSMADGEFLVLVGPSGCGKSTLMNIIAGLEEPSAGQLRLDGRDITPLPPADRNISMVFQSYALYPNMTVAKNIEFPLAMRKVEKSKRAERVQSVAKLLQIEHLLERKPRQLSGGQRQRVAIGRALACEPRLYPFDEPLSNLYAPLRLDMRSAMNAHIGAEVIAGIRAEAVNLAGPGMMPGKTERAFDARVEVIEPTGADTLAVLDLSGNEFTVRLEPDVTLKPGQDARFFVDLAKLVCFDVKTEKLIA